MDPDKNPWNQPQQPNGLPARQHPHQPPVVPGGAPPPQNYIDPNRFYQPSVPAGPQNATYQQPYAESYQAQMSQYSATLPYAVSTNTDILVDPVSASRRLLRRLIIGAVFIGLSIVIAASAYSIFKPAPKPSAVFQSALQTALSTKSVTLSTTTNSATASEVMTTKYLLANNQHLQASMLDTITSKGKTTLKLEGYGTKSNTYLKVDKSTSIDKQLQNTWIQLRKNGTLPDPIDAVGTHYPVYDPRYALLSGFVFANASAAAQTSYIDYLQKQQIYSYDTTAVTKETLGKVAAYRYEVTIKHPALLVKEEAALLGIKDTTAIDYATASLTARPRLVLHISIGNPRLLAINVGSNSTTLYGSYDTTTLPKEPNAALQYTAYGVLVSSGNAVTDGAVNDAKRQSALGAIQTSLESYYAIAGSYPSLTDMNSSDWVAANLPDLEQATLQDPTGKSPSLTATPAKNQYAYQVTADDGSSSCETDDSTCQLYTLVATLSDGSTYSLQNATSPGN